MKRLLQNRGDIFAKQDLAYIYFNDGGIWNFKYRDGIYRNTSLYRKYLRRDNCSRRTFNKPVRFRRSNSGTYNAASLFGI